MVCGHGGLHAPDGLAVFVEEDGAVGLVEALEAGVEFLVLV